MIIVPYRCIPYVWNRASIMIVLLLLLSQTVMLVLFFDNYDNHNDESNCDLYYAHPKK